MESKNLSIKEQYEKALQPTLVSGCFKFSLDYVSKLQVFEAVQKWCEKDKNVLSASLRAGGSDSVAVDFRYQISGDAEEKSSQLLHKVIKPFFITALGDDYFAGWDYANSTLIVK